MEIVMLHNDDPISDALVIPNGVSTVSFRGDVYCIRGDELVVVAELGSPSGVTAQVVLTGFPLCGLIEVRGRLFATQRSRGAARIYEIRP